MTNSPDASPSQVHITLKRNENKIMMRHNDLQQQQPQQRQHYHQQHRHQELYLLGQQIRSTQPIPIHSFNSTENCGNGSLSSKINKQLHFNPYADENDSISRFQLSKSIINKCNVGSSSVGAEISTGTNEMFYRPRIFGADRTNSMQMDRIPFPNKSPNVINLRKENFHTINISNNMILNNSSYICSGNYEHSQSSQLIKEDPEMSFKSYDLNSEYWLNFE